MLTNLLLTVIFILKDYRSIGITAVKLQQVFLTLYLAGEANIQHWFETDFPEYLEILPGIYHLDHTQYRKSEKISCIWYFDYPPLEEGFWSGWLDTPFFDSSAVVCYLKTQYTSIKPNQNTWDLRKSKAWWFRLCKQTNKSGIDIFPRKYLLL